MFDLDFNSNLIAVAAATLAVMLLGTVVRLGRMRSNSPEWAQARLASLRSWWWVVLAILCAAVLGRAVAVLLFALVSGLAFHEFCTLRKIGPPAVLRAAYFLLACGYLAILLGWTDAFFGFLPVAGLIILAVTRLRYASLNGYSTALGELYWGLLLTAYAPAFGVLLFTVPPSGNPVAGPAGWFLFLMLVTEVDDISQALIGRAVGRRPIAPVISPHKTWAGLVGGILVSCLLAALLAPWLTPWSSGMAMLAGLLISLSGFCGDLNISGIKRDCGVKDSGHLLPGQGGILDRIDSLTFAAPVFYAFVRLSDAYSAGGAQ